MKYIKYIVFTIGLIALVSGFLLSKASDLPWVLSTISPNFVSASTGLTKLESLDSLTLNDEGFEQIATLLANNLSGKTRPEQVSWKLIELVSYKGSQGTFATHLGPVAKMPVDVRLTSGQLIQTDLTAIRNGVEGLKNQSLNFWAYSLFGLGLLLYAFEFVWSQIKRKK